MPRREKEWFTSPFLSVEVQAVTFCDVVFHSGHVHTVGIAGSQDGGLAAAESCRREEDTLPVWAGDTDAVDTVEGCPLMGTVLQQLLDLLG